MVLAVGARLSGQASSATLTSSIAVGARASVESGLPVMAISGTPSRLITGRMVSDLGGLAGIGRCHHHVLVGDHADVAMTGLGRMQEKRWRAGAGQGRGDLVADVPGLAHAGHDDSAAAVVQQLAGRTKSPSRRRLSACTAATSVASTRRPRASNCSESNGRTSVKIAFGMIARIAAFCGDRWSFPVMTACRCQRKSARPIG